MVEHSLSGFAQFLEDDGRTIYGPVPGFAFREILASLVAMALFLYHNVLNACFLWCDVLNVLNVSHVDTFKCIKWKNNKPKFETSTLSWPQSLMVYIRLDIFCHSIAGKATLLKN